MSVEPLAFLELFIVLAFLIGWFVLERVARRFDKKPPKDDESPKKTRASARLGVGSKRVFRRLDRQQRPTGRIFCH